MNRLIYFSLFILFLLYASCTKDKNAAEAYISLDIKDEKISLLDIAQDMDFIELGNDTECLVRSVRRVSILDNRIYLNDKKGSWVVFDSIGNCLFKLNERGKGPGEYGRAAHSVVNLWNNNIEILEHGGVLHTYSENGKHIESHRIELPSGLPTFPKFARISEDLIILYQCDIPTEMLYIYSTSTHKYINSYIENKDIKRAYNYLPGVLGCYVDHDFHYFDHQTGEIFKFNEGELVPYTSLNLGVYNMDLETILREVHEEEFPHDCATRMGKIHPIYGFSSDYSIFVAYANGAFRTYVKTTQSESGYYPLYEIFYMDEHNIIPYLPFTEVRKDDELRFYGVIIDDQDFSNDLISANRVDIDEYELKLLQNYNPENDNPILFSYRNRRHFK